MLNKRLIPIVFPLILVASSLQAMAQDASAGKDKVVVKINDYAITAKEVSLASDDILPQLADVPPRLRYPMVVEYLVERHLLAQEAVRVGIPDTPEYKDRLTFYQAKALRDSYYAKKLKPLISEDQVRKAYDAQAKKIKPLERVRARHILVGTEKEAKAVIKRLKAGEKFEAVAKAVSLDGSKDYGGDLGYFTADEMVPEFSKAAFKLKKNEVSAPVKTEFGWHVIKLEDRDEGGPQPYAQVKNAIKLILFRQAVQNEVFKLKDKAKIEIFDPDLKKMQEETDKKRKKLLEMNKKKKESQTGAEGAENNSGKSGKGDKVE